MTLQPHISGVRLPTTWGARRDLGTSSVAWHICTACRHLLQSSSVSLYLCRLIGKVLKYPLLDTDALIEESTSRTVAEIFEQEGEESFRELETSVLKVRRLEAGAPSWP